MIRCFRSHVGIEFAVDEYEITRESLAVNDFCRTMGSNQIRLTDVGERIVFLYASEQAVAIRTQAAR